MRFRPRLRPLFILVLLVSALIERRSAPAGEALEVLENPRFADVLAAARKSGKPILVHVLTEH